MKLFGITAEYNPFHNGHKYHIQATRSLGATHIAVVMSGDFVQRGEPAILDKFTRARLAIQNGADLVVELPAVYSLAPAEQFARGSIFLLKQLDCHGISFGSESGNLDSLAEMGKRITDWNSSMRLKEKMESGLSYPAALQRLAEEDCPESAGLLSSPNDLLGIEYLRSAEFLGFQPEFSAIKRMGVCHDGNAATEEFASASYIREAIFKNESFQSFLPENGYREILSAENAGLLGNLQYLERIILARLRTLSPEDAALIPDACHGLENRLISPKGASLQEVLEELKARRYPMARIKRILLCALIGITAKDREVLPPYGRILAIDEKGKEILRRAEEISCIPFHTSPAKLSKTGEAAERFSLIESRASDLYGLASKTIRPTGQNLLAKITLAPNAQEEA